MDTSKKGIYLKKIAILYICLGKYSVFWKSFFESSEKNLCNRSEKNYYVFTDCSNLSPINNKVHIISQKKLGWPNDTLMRFSMFLKIESELKKYDYIYFFNANLVIFNKISESEFLPKNPSELVVVLHPSFYNKTNLSFPYERNQASLAFIPFNSGKFYVQGALNGGTSRTYLKFVHVVSDAIVDDYSRGIVAKWHDESHLNKYILNKSLKILNSGYVYPEFSFLPYALKILSVDKNKFGGHKWLRSEKLDIFLCGGFVISIFKYYIKSIIYHLRCFFGNS